MAVLQWDFGSDGRLLVENTSETLRQAATAAQRLVGDDVEIDVQISFGGLEDQCADAVELGAQSDAKAVEAIRMRRIAARALSAAGFPPADIGYLVGLPRGSAKHLLDGPLDAPWMGAGLAPPLERPPALADTARPGNRRIFVVLVTPHEGRWLVHLEAGPQVRATLGFAERFVRELIDDPSADLLLAPQLPADLEEAVQTADTATAEDEDLRLRTYELRADLTRRLAGLGIGARDIGDLLGIHEHRVRTLLTHDETAKLRPCQPSAASAGQVETTDQPLHRVAASRLRVVSRPRQNHRS